MTPPDDATQPPAAVPTPAGGLPLPGGGRLSVPPWVQLIGLPMALLFSWVFLKAASHAVVVFLIAMLISLLLNPVVRRLQRRGVPRIVSVLLVFGAFAAIVTVLTVLAVDLVAEQAGNIRANSGQYGDAAERQIDGVQSFIDRRGWQVDVRDQGLELVAQLEERSTELSSQALDFGRQFLAVVAQAAFNVVLIIVITIYMLLDAPRIGRFVSSMLPTDSRVETLFGRLERSLLRYTIGQSLASLVMGLSATVGLWLIGVTGLWDGATKLAVLFGIIVAITEFAPSIGPIIGAIPPIVTALFDGLAPALVVAVFFLILHQIEGHIVIPKLMGAAIAVHPLIVIFGILAGAQILGIGGILLALPLLAVLREVVLFTRERIVFGKWPEPAAAGVGGLAHSAAGTSGHLGQQDAGRAAGPLARSGAFAGPWAQMRQRWARRSRGSIDATEPHLDTPGAAPPAGQAEDSGEADA